MPGIDANVKLMLHMNGTDGSTTFTDDSDSGHVGTANGQAQIDTAQLKFGSASGLFDGSGDYVSFPDHADWDFGTNDMAIDCWVRFSSVSGNQCIVGRPTSGSSYLYLALEGGGIRFRDFNGGNIIDANFGAISLSINTWYHFAVTRSGSDFRFFVNGTQHGSTYVNASAFTVRSTVLEVGANSVIGYYFNGWIDELRISNGNARWTTTFTPPTEEYNAFDESITESLEISDTIDVQDTSVIQTEDIQVNDTVEVTNTNSDAHYATKIISVNPLIFITDTNPVELVKVDITDPQNPTWNIITLFELEYSRDLAINIASEYLYIAGNDGLVLKINLNDFGNRTVIDLNDTDILLQIETNSNIGLTYVSTDSINGELYVIDERSMFTLNSNLEAVSLNTFEIDSDFNIVEAFLIDSSFEALSYQYFTLKSDFKCLSQQSPVLPPSTPSTPYAPIDAITPIKLTDYHVYLDNVELENTDLILDSIQIVHSVGEESTATFRLSRKHDAINTTLSGNTKTITNQNEIRITCNGKTIFPYNNEGTGKISDLNCQYSDTDEYIQVTALAPEPSNKFNLVTLSLPSLTSRLFLYDVLIQNPRIFNPYIDPNNEENPKKYKGIRVDLGTKIEQHYIRWSISDASGNVADAIRAGTFNPLQNWTYFWRPTVRRLGVINLGDVVTLPVRYIGTSLAPITEDLWHISNAHYLRERQKPNKETALGFYEVGEAPFKDVNASNGRLITKPHLVDEPNGLYNVTEESYNFVEYIKKVAELEYENLKNINGEILPDTSCSFTLTIDGYLYYDLALLTRINVDNTTQAGIYKNANGFPVSIKSITITSSDRKVTLDADNSKSLHELEIINEQFPDENDEEYHEEEKRIFIQNKIDLRTLLQVE